MTEGTPQALTLVLPACSGSLDSLRGTLARLDGPVRGALRAAPSVGHLALCALPGRRDGGDDGAALLLETTFRGELSAHAAELWGAIGGTLSELGASFGLSALGGERRFFELLRDRASRVHAFYVAHRSAHADVSNGVSFLERAAVFGPAPWFELEERVRRRFRKHLHNGAPELPNEPLRDGRAPFAALFPVRPGRSRANALRRALRFADSVFSSAAPAARARGPGGLAALHTARFVLLPDDRMLVTALVDGPTAVFFDRLSAQSSPVLSAVFMHTEAFPSTHFGVLGGARRHAEFRRWLRAFQLSPGIWYSAYPDLSR